MISLSYLSIAGLILLSILSTCAFFGVRDLLKKIKKLEKEIKNLKEEKEKEIKSLKETKKYPVYSMMAGLEDVLSYLRNLKMAQEEQKIGLDAVNFWIEKLQTTAYQARGGSYDPNTPTGPKPRTNKNIQPE